MNLQKFALGACALLLSLPLRAAEPTLSLVFVGDIVLDGEPGKDIEAGKDPFADFSSEIDGADIRLGNLECVVATTGTAEEKNFTFRAHPRVLPILKKHFDAVAIANNHSGDFGPAAFGEMLGLLDQQQLPYFGGGRTLHDAHQPLIIERKGLRIALLGYDEFMPRQFEADVAKPGIAWSEDEQVVADIRAARSKYHADLVIPVMHWGWENEFKASERQHLLARLMIDAGADAVIGGHPHVIQNTDNYRGKPIFYSVGNFMIDSLDNDDQMRGWAIRLELDKHGVRAWKTVLAQLDERGIPHRAPKSASPCWQRGQATVPACPVE